MKLSLKAVCDQFPHLRKEVTQLFERNELFQELCEDYEACAEAVDRQPAAESLRREYAALQLRLETELLRYLHDDADPPNRRHF